MMSRLDETIYVIQNIAGDLPNLKNEADCLVLITTVLCDIAKSLASIADSLTDSEPSGSEQERWLSGE